jgi:acetylglutamate kinase
VKLRDLDKLGLVGEVVRVNPKIINDLLDMGYLPVVSPVANDANGQALNINADIAAGAIAGALRATQMFFMTDVPGIYSNWPDKTSLISEIEVSTLKSMTFADGMVPKVEAAINAVESGAASARIMDGTSLDAFTDALAGKGGTWVKR